MKQIDWSKAPEWATKHGIVGAYRENQIWFNDTQYIYCDGRQGGRAILFTGGCVYKPNEIYAITERPTAPQWNGEGLPPVGATVMLDDEDFPVFEDYREMIGVPVIVTASFKSPTGVDMIACAMPTGLCGCFRADMARKAKTPEQIAAEEREADIKRMVSILHEEKGSSTGPVEQGFCMALYDSGLRFPKVEQGK